MKNSTSTDRAKKAEIYRNAAKIMEQSAEEFSCFAIHRAGGAESLCTAMKAIYKPRSRDIAWMQGIGMPDSLYNLNHPLERGGRVLALCFMAAMVEAGDA